jgi:uncharacterized protein (DUF4415 family)
MKATEFDQLFDDNEEDIMAYLDLENARRPNLQLNSPLENFESTTITIEREILNTFRATGADWQNQINVALKQWLQEHSLVHSI